MTSLPSSAPLDGSLDFESCGGTLHELQDGHIPETHSKNSQYIRYNDMDKTPSLLVNDNVLPGSIVDALYEITVAEGQPWGTYVTIKQVEKYWESPPTILDVNESSHDDLSLHAVAHFVKTMTSESAGTTTRIPSTAPQQSLDILSSSGIHGVAVWALASDGRQVHYHVDYAELVRYEHNVLAAPVWAGTLQCTSRPIEGGQFAVNLQGMNHYERHGYKGNKSGDPMGGWSEPVEREAVDWNQETGWVTIPYRYNRMIGHSGHLPHLSAPFACRGGYRVIVGFNVFRNDVGPTVSQAPEHSHAFRRRVQCHRALLYNQPKKLSLKSIRQNKALTKLLVLAKREKVKADLRKAQQKLDEDIDAMLQMNGSVNVETLMNSCSRRNGEWPSVIDVQVHIQRRVNNGMLLCDSNENLSLESMIHLNPA